MAEKEKEKETETDRSEMLKGSDVHAYLKNHSSAELQQETDELTADLKNLLGTSLSALMEMHPELCILNNIGISVTISVCDQPFMQCTYGAANGVKKALKMAVDAYNKIPDVPSFKDTAGLVAHAEALARDDPGFMQFLEKEANNNPSAKFVLDKLKGTEA